MSTEQTKKKVGRPKGTTKPGPKKKYGFIQLEESVYNELRDYCNENGFKFASFTAIAIRKYIKQLKQLQ